MAPLFTAPNAGMRFASVLSRHFRQITLIAALIFVAALAGSLSRPTGFLAAFWPANAVLAGLLLRNVMLGKVTVLLAAAAGCRGGWRRALDCCADDAGQYRFGGGCCGAVGHQ